MTFSQSLLRRGWGPRCRAGTVRASQGANGVRLGGVATAILLPRGRRHHTECSGSGGKRANFPVHRALCVSRRIVQFRWPARKILPCVFGVRGTNAGASRPKDSGPDPTPPIGCFFTGWPNRPPPVDGLAPNPYMAGTNRVHIPIPSCRD